MALLQGEPQSCSSLDKGVRRCAVCYLDHIPFSVQKREAGIESLRTTWANFLDLVKNKEINGKEWRKEGEKKGEKVS